MGIFRKNANKGHFQLRIALLLLPRGMHELSGQAKRSSWRGSTIVSLTIGSAERGG